MADNALQVVAPSQIQTNQPQTFAPRTLAEAIEFAKLIADSGMVPRDYAGKPGAIVLAIQLGYEVGLPPIQALQSIYTVNNRPALWGDGALAIVKTHPDFISIHEDDPETVKKNNKATCIIKRRGQPDVKATFGQEDAVTAGLWKKAGPWTTAPFRMMQMRARAFAMRDQFPDALKGLKTVEEVRDYGDTIEGEVVQPSTPAVEQKPAAEETIGQSGGSDWYKKYKSNGYTPEEAKKWLADNLQIGPPHNEKNSKDIPVSKKDAAFAWANTPSPIKLAVNEAFDLLEFKPDERAAFFALHKDFKTVHEALLAEAQKRDAAERGE
jgi:hypothetical protein